MRLTLENTGSSPESSFFLAFPAADAVGDLVVTRGGGASPTLLVVSPAEAEEGPRAAAAVAAATAAGAALYRVALPGGLAAGASDALRVRYLVADALVPVPAALPQGESQYVRWTGSARWLSPYPTRTETTTVAVAPSGLTSTPTEPAPVSVAGHKVTAGPYTDVPPYGASAAAGGGAPLRLRFLLNQPLLVAERFVKTVIVSHWGTARVREAYWLTNAAAAHDGPWSRLDYARNPGATSPTAVHSAWLRLPAAAADVQYRDLIGNVTSSRLRLPRRAAGAVPGGTALMLTLRYPMLGGWRDHFWVDYLLPVATLLRTAPTMPSRHALVLPDYGSSWSTELPVRALEVRVALPARASVLSVSTPTGGGGGGAGWSVSRDTTAGTLSFGGRPTLVFRASHVASGSAATAAAGAAGPTDAIVIHYVYGLGGLLAAPVAVVSALAAAYLALLIARRTTLSLTPPSAAEVALAASTATTLTAARATATALAAVLTAMDDHVSRSVSALGRDWAPAAAAEVVTLDADARRREAELAGVASRLAAAATAAAAGGGGGGARKAGPSKGAAADGVDGGGGAAAAAASSAAVAAADAAAARVVSLVRKCAAKRQALVRAAGRRRGIDAGQVNPNDFAEECRDTLFPTVDGLTTAIDTAVRDLLDG